MLELIESVTVEVTVPLSREEAFELFTHKFGHWWPHDYSYSGEVLAGIEFGKAEGEWCYELGPHGFRCDFGRIFKWEPPSRVAFTWQIGPKSTPQPNPSKASLVTVTFAERSAGQVSVAVEHSDFARHGEGAAHYRAEMASEYGWPFVLEQYAVAAKNDRETV